MKTVLIRLSISRRSFSMILSLSLLSLALLHAPGFSMTETGDERDERPVGSDQGGGTYLVL